MANSNDVKEVEEGIDLEHYGVMFLSNWYWFVVSVLFSLCVAVFVIMRTTPIYTRSTQLLIKEDDKNSSVIPKEFKDMGLGVTSSNMKNELLTISAPIIMENAVKRLNLDVQLTTREGLMTRYLYNDAPIKLTFANKYSDDVTFSFNVKLVSKNEYKLTDFTYGKEKFDDEVVAKAGTMVSTPVGQMKVELTPSWDDDFVGKNICVVKHDLAIISKAFKQSMTIELSEKDATVLNMTINDPVPARADDILLTVIDIYNENWVKDKNRVAENTCNFINERLESITKELGDVDEDISNYKSANLLPDIQATLVKDMTQSGKNYETLLELNNQLSMTKFIHDYLADKTKENQLLPSNTGLPSSGVENMILAYNTLMLERSTYLTNSTEDSPIIKDMDRKLAAQKTAILRSLDNLVIQLRKQISNIERSERQINSQIASTPHQVKELQSVERQQKVKEALYIFLLQKREENELSRTYTAWNSNIIQPPTGSVVPTSPRKSMILLLALVVGFTIPGGLIVLYDGINHKVRGRKDLEGMDVPLIGEIPSMMQKKHWWQKKQNVQRAIVVEKNNRDIINESFRIVRTKLDYFIGKKEGCPVLMFTSFNPGSGKSFVSANLAAAFGLNDKKIIVLDMDFRHRSLTGMVNKTVKEGITSYLNGMNENLNELIVRNGLGQNVDALCVGVIPPNPAELMGSERMAQLLNELRQRYDYIFLDCPPIEIVADASIIKKYADISIFVVRAGLMDRRALQDVDKLYKANQYNRLTLLLNGTDYVSGKYGQFRYGYGYGYGYGYAEGYHENNN